MDRLTQSVLVTLVGGALVALTASGRFALYVKTGFGPLLLAAGIALILVGAASVVLALRSHRRRPGAVAITTAATDTAALVMRSYPCAASIGSPQKTPGTTASPVFTT